MPYKIGVYLFRKVNLVL